MFFLAPLCCPLLHKWKSLKIKWTLFLASNLTYFPWDSKYKPNYFSLHWNCDYATVEKLQDMKSMAAIVNNTITTIKTLKKLNPSLNPSTLSQYNNKIYNECRFYFSFLVFLFNSKTQFYSFYHKILQLTNTAT